MNVIPKDKDRSASYGLQVKQRSEGEADRKEKNADEEWKSILENEHRASRSVTRPKQESQETRNIDSKERVMKKMEANHPQSSNFASAQPRTEDEPNDSSSSTLIADGVSDEILLPPTLFNSSGSSQLSSTVALTLRAYSFIFSLYNWAASAFAGLFGFGSCSRLCILVKIAATS